MFGQYKTIGSGKLKGLVNLQNGQLVSLIYNDGKQEPVEFWHGGGKHSEDKNSADKLGWQNSEITMFPLVGPSCKEKGKENTIIVNGKQYRMNQHGLSRALEWEEFQNVPMDAGKEVKLRQVNCFDNLVENLKFDKKMSESMQNNKNQEFPFGWGLGKIIRINGGVTFEHTMINFSENTMKYMIGQHPAFRVLGDPYKGIFSDDNNKTYKLEDIVAKGGEFIPETSTITYTNLNSGFGIQVESNSYNGNFMIWTPHINSGMFCIEPVSQFPIVLDKFKDFDRAKIESLNSLGLKRYEYIVRPIIDNTLLFE